MRDSKVNTTKSAVKVAPVVILNLTGGVTTLSQSSKSKAFETFSDEIIKQENKRTTSSPRKTLLTKTPSPRSQSPYKTTHHNVSYSHH